MMGTTSEILVGNNWVIVLWRLIIEVLKIKVWYNKCKVEECHSPKCAPGPRMDNYRLSEGLPGEVWPLLWKQFIYKADTIIDEINSLHFNFQTYDFHVKEQSHIQTLFNTNKIKCHFCYSNSSFLLTLPPKGLSLALLPASIYFT